MASFFKRFYRFISLPPVRVILGFFWVGGFIGLGAGLQVVLPAQFAVAAPLLLALGALLGYYSFVRIVEQRAVPELVSKFWLGELVLGLALGAGLFCVVMGIITLSGGYTVAGTNPWPVMVPTLMTAVMAGVTEELLIRAVAFRILESWLGSWIALAISAALFGLIHLPNPNATALSALAIALEAGGMLAAAYMVTRRAWLAIGIHIAWNFTQSGIFGVATSGVDTAGYFKGSLQGPSVITGGAFGPEASIIAVVVCVAAGVAMLILAKRRGHIVLPQWQRKAS